MKYVDEYRSAELARGLASEIAGLVRTPLELALNTELAATAAIAKARAVV